MDNQEDSHTPPDKVWQKREDKMNEKHICCICGKEFTGYGNNPYPIVEEEDARCCDECNANREWSRCVMSKGIEFEVELQDKDLTLVDYIDIYAVPPMKRMLKTHPFLWVYAKADQMTDHKFTDDVCICYALTKRQAYKKFSELYASIDMDDIQRVYFWNKGTSILTDY